MFPHFSFETLISSHITIAVNLSFHGPEDFTCRYGGISFFDFHQNTSTMKEIYKFCSEKQNYFHKLKNVHSSGPHMAVVVYAYEHYTSLQVSLDVTSTACQIIKFNLCPVAQKYLENLVGNIFGRHQDNNYILQHPVFFLNNLFNAEYQTFPRSQIDLSNHTCYIVNFFTKSFDKCETISFAGNFLPVINSLFGTYVAFKTLQDLLYNFTIEGILVSKGEVHSHKRVAMEWTLSL